MRYESHPGKPLQEHLQEVAEGARARLNHPGLRHRELLREAAHLVGLTHDLGKYTPYFQEHLHTKRSFEGGLERHAFLGALCAAWLLNKRLDDLPEGPHKEFLPLLGYLAVHRHHGHLVAPRAILPPLGDPSKATGELWRALRALERQLDTLRSQRDWVREWEALGLKDLVEFVEEPDLDELFHALDWLNYKLKDLDEDEGARLCLWGQLLFSALIDADKVSAAAINLPKRISIPEDLVERFLRERYPEPRHTLDRLRAEFQRAVRDRLRELSPEELPGKVLSLTAPTGLGKTLTALDAALRLRVSLQRICGESYTPRIVYALPFINIIEQNYRVFHEVFRLLSSNRSVPESLLLRHHHLAEIAYRSGDEKLSLDRALLMVEAWESEVIVTTFVQLFQTIVGYRNRFLKKLHNLIGSILILDEVQALPMEFWPLTARVFETLRRELGLIVLQMTATRPLIFSKPKELHPNPPALFRSQRRTRLLIEHEELPLDAWVDRIIDLYKKHGSLLAVVNTVRASLEIYRALRERVSSAVSYKLQPPRAEEWLVYLSTNIVPWQRRTRLKALKGHLKRGGRALVVSTQVIEAGVDIDFPATVRDLGPIDAMVQVAGRCNREGALPEGHVYVLPLKDGGCTRVYGAIHVHVTKRLLEDLHELSEPAYAKLVERYFHETQSRLSQGRASKLWQAYTRLAYDKFEEDEITLSEFHLIESPEQVPIFVALTPKRGHWLLQEFMPQVLEERDPQKRRIAYLRHRRRLHDLTVRPLLQRAVQNLPPALAEPEGLRWVPHTHLDTFYDEETGFRWEPAELQNAWIE